MHRVRVSPIRRRHHVRPAIRPAVVPLLLFMRDHQHRLTLMSVLPPRGQTMFSWYRLSKPIWPYHNGQRRNRRYWRSGNRGERAYRPGLTIWPLARVPALIRWCRYLRWWCRYLRHRWCRSLRWCWCRYRYRYAARRRCRCRRERLSRWRGKCWNTLLLRTRTRTARRLHILCVKN
jgi:hypothetical protein